MKTLARRKDLLIALIGLQMVAGAGIMNLPGQAADEQAAIPYSPFFIAWQVRSSVINNKGQIAGIEDKGTEQVLHVWLPAADYGLAAGPHAFPFPFHIGHTQLIDFADNGSALFGWPGFARLTLYFSVSEGVFHPLETLMGLPIYTDGLGNSVGLGAAPYNMSPNGTIFGFDTGGGQTREDDKPFKFNPGTGLLSFSNPPPDSAASGGVSVQVWRGNSSGDQVAGQITGGGPGPWPYQGGLWRNGVFIPLPLPPMEGRLSDINDKGQVLGATPGAGGPLSFMKDPFVYLPASDYGMSAGFHPLDYSPSPNVFSQNEIRISGHGEIHITDLYNDSYDFGRGGPEFYSLELGRTVDLNASLVPGATAVVSKIRRINDSGVILATGLDGAGTPGLLILSPVIVATAKAEPKQVEVGDLVTLTVQIQNNTDEPFVLAGVSAGKLWFTGSGNVQQLDNAPSILDLLPGETGTQTFHFQATELGTVRFSIQGLGIHPDGTRYETGEIQSNAVRISSKGDLLIKRDDEPDSAYAMDDTYQEAPVLRQRRTEFIRSTDTLAYQVKIENDGKAATTFFLRVDETDTEGWTTSYLQNGVDISAAVQSLEAWETPELEPGESLIVQVDIAPQPDMEEHEAEFLIYLLADAGDLVALDAVAIVPITRDVIVVNVTGDEQDADPDDGVIDVDLDTDGEQITLRAAIDFANQREGKDRIEFDIPGGGIPKIKLDLPPEGANVFASGTILGHKYYPNDPVKLDIRSSIKVTDSVEIDGTTQPGGWVELSAASRFDSYYRYASYPVIGVEIATGNCEVSGFIINGFTSCGMVLSQGEGNWIHSNRIGTDATGKQAIGNTSLSTYWYIRSGVERFWGSGLALLSGGHLIGGPQISHRNIIAGNFRLPQAEQDAYAASRNDHVYMGAVYMGAQLAIIESSGSWIRIQNNYFGLGVDGIPIEEDGVIDSIPAYSIGIFDSAKVEIGGPNAASANGTGGIIVLGSNDIVIQGNKIGFSPVTGKVFVRKGVVIVEGRDIALGGTFAGAGNIIAGGSEVLGVFSVAGLSIWGNWINTSPEGILVDAEGHSLIRMGGPGVVLGGVLEGQGNVIAAKVAVTDSESQVLGNDFQTPPINKVHFVHIPMLDLNQDLKLNPSDFPDLDGLQNAPKLHAARIESGELRVTGELDAHVGVNTYDFDFYAVSVPNFDGHGGTMKYIGRVQGNPGNAGLVGFEFVRPVGPDVTLNDQISATVTRLGGATSEFSKNVPIDDEFFSDSDGSSDVREKLFGDRNNDGTSDHLQNNVASFAAANGALTTVEVSMAMATAAALQTAVERTMNRLQSAAGPILENVTSESQASIGAPVGYSYSNGVIVFGVANVSAGSSVTARLILSDEAVIDTVWALTGQTWTDAIPFAFNTGELTLTLTDGATGDRDGAANGRIAAALGPASALPPEPPLELRIEPTTFGVALSWPLSTPSAILETSADLTPESWEPVAVPADFDGERWRIALNFLADSMNQTTFFRLRSPNGGADDPDEEPNLILNGGFESEAEGTSVTTPPDVVDGATFTGWRVFNVDSANASFSAAIIGNASAGGRALRLEVNNTAAAAAYALDQWAPAMHTPVQPGTRYRVSFDAAWIAGLDADNLLFQVQEFDGAGGGRGRRTEDGRRKTENVLGPWSSVLGPRSSVLGPRSSVATTDYQTHTFDYQAVNAATAGIGLFFGPLRGMTGATALSLDQVQTRLAPP